MAGAVPSASNLTTGNVMLANSNNVYNQSSQHHSTVNRQGSTPAPSSQFITTSLNHQYATNSTGMLASQVAQPKFIPSLRLKSNEFFYKWISDKERGEQLNEIISFIKANNRIPKLNDLQSFKVSSR